MPPAPARCATRSRAPSSTPSRRSRTRRASSCSPASTTSARSWTACPGQRPPRRQRQRLDPRRCPPVAAARRADQLNILHVEKKRQQLAVRKSKTSTICQTDQTCRDLATFTSFSLCWHRSLQVSVVVAESNSNHATIRAEVSLRNEDVYFHRSSSCCGGSRMVHPFSKEGVAAVLLDFCTVAWADDHRPGRRTGRFVDEPLLVRRRTRSAYRCPFADLARTCRAFAAAARARRAAEDSCQGCLSDREGSSGAGR